MTRANELRELDDDELHGHLAETRRELLNLRFQLATGQLDNSARLGQVKKDVARVMTLLREREIALAEGRVIEPLPHVERPPRPSRRRADEALDEDEEAQAVEVSVAEDVMEDEVLAPGAEDEPARAEPAEPGEAPKRAGRVRRRRAQAEADAETSEAAGHGDEEEQ
jgi:large subunit ribosomal protein L29